ncbi:MAG: type II toxin-antitoxin system HicB family antitoxin [Candidatus Anammoxibacter sp.]
MKLLEIPVIAEFVEDTYIAKCPVIQGAFAEGESPEDSIRELVDVVKSIMVYRKERGERLCEDMVVDTNKVITAMPIGI